MGRRALALFLLSCLLLAPRAWAGGHEAAPALYLEDHDPVSEAYNLTTYAPDANATGSAIQFISTGTEAGLTWTMAGVPAPWDVTDRSVHRAVLFLSGLDEVFPVPPQDPERAATTLGRIEIQARLEDSARETLLVGSTLFEPDHLRPRDDVFEIEVAMRAPRAVTVSAAAGNDYLTFFIVVSGRNITQTNISPVHIHVGAPDTPSRLVLDGFPYEAYRGWEDLERAERERNDAILRGGSPTPPAAGPATPATDPPGPSREPLPGAGILPLLAAISGAVWVARRVSTG